MFVGSIPNIPKSFHDPPGSNLSPSSNIMQLSPSSCLATIPLFGQESTHPPAASASFWKAWLSPQTIWHHYLKQTKPSHLHILKPREISILPKFPPPPQSIPQFLGLGMLPLLC